jgi:predicted PurR-regulated permease PerM
VTDLRAPTIWKILLNVLLLASGIYLVWRLSTILTWISIAILIALALEPLVARLIARGVPRGLALLAVIGGVLALVVGIFATVVPMLIEQARMLIVRSPEYVARLGELEIVRAADRRFGIGDQIQHRLAEQVGGLATPAFDLATGVVRVVFTAITILALTVFALVAGREVLDGAFEWIPPARRPHVRMLAGRMHRVVSGYVLGTLLVATIGGIVMGVTVAAVGVPYFVPLALLMILLALFPYVGSVIGAVLVIGTTLASAGLRAAVIVTIVYLVYQQVEGHVLHPIVQRRTIRMNPFLVSIAILAGAALAGIAGTLLALPIAGALQVLLEDLLERRRARWAKGEARASVA